MVDFQLPLPGLSRDFNELTKQEKVGDGTFPLTHNPCQNLRMNNTTRNQYL